MDGQATQMKQERVIADAGTRRLQVKERTAFRFWYIWKVEFFYNLQT